MKNKTNEINEKPFTEFKFEGFKNSEAIICDSPMLLNYLIFLEWDSKVESYLQPQQMEIVVDYENAHYEAKIDLWVNLRSGRSKLINFLDAKWLQLLNEHPMLHARFSRLCLESNLRYEPVSSFETNREPLASNLRLLWKNARQKFEMMHIRAAERFFERNCQTSIGKLQDEFTEAGYAADLVYTLIFHKLVLADVFYFPLTNETAVLPGAAYPSPEDTPPILLVEKLRFESSTGKS